MRRNLGRLEEAAGSQLAEGPRAIVAALLLLVTVGVSAFTVLENVDPAVTDAVADWLTVNAAADGLDPWSDLRDLSDHYRVDYGIVIGAGLDIDDARVHPRTPGALLLMAPLASIPPTSAYPAAIALAIACYLLTGLLTVKETPYRPSVVLIAAAVGTASAAYLTTIKFGTHAGILLLAVTAGWWLSRQDDSWGAGVAFGVAVTLRLFPALLLIPLLMARRWKGITMAAAVFVSANLIGLVLFDLSISRAIEAMGRAADSWAGFAANGSLVMPLVNLGAPVNLVAPVLVLVGIGTVVALSMTRPWQDALAGATVIALLVSPLSWEHYDLIAIPAVILVIDRLLKADGPRRAATILVGVFVLLQVVTPVFFAVTGSGTHALTGAVIITGRVALLGAVYSCGFLGGKRDGVRPAGAISAGLGDSCG